MTPEIQDQNREGQDLSEVFDEDALADDETRQQRAERRTFDEMVDVADYTRAVGDGDDEAGLIGEDLDPEQVIDLEADAALADFEDDEIAGRLPEELHADRSSPARMSEIPARNLEADRPSAAEIAALDHAAPDDDPRDGAPGAPVVRRRSD